MTNPAIYNWYSSNTLQLEAGLTAAIKKAGYCDILVVGDSISSMYNGSAYNFRDSWWRVLNEYLKELGVPSGGTGIVGIDVGTDPRFITTGTVTNNWSYLTLAGSGSTVTFTSVDEPGSKVDVYYANNGGNFTVAIDGGSPVIVTTTGTSTYGTYSVSNLSNKPHTVTVNQMTSTDVYLFGFQVYQTYGLRFHNGGVGFGQTAQSFGYDNTFAGRQQNSLAYMPNPNLVLLAIGSNDIYGGTSFATTVTDITTCANLFPSSDYIFTVEPDLNVGSWATWVSDMQTLVTSTFNSPLVDLYARYGSQATYIAAGLVGVDNHHFNEVAHRDWGTLVFQALVQNSGILAGAFSQRQPKLEVHDHFAEVVDGNPWITESMHAYALSYYPGSVADPAVSNGLLTNPDNTTSTSISAAIATVEANGPITYLEADFFFDASGSTDGPGVYLGCSATSSSGTLVTISDSPCQVSFGDQGYIMYYVASGIVTQIGSTVAYSAAQGTAKQHVEIAIDADHNTAYVRDPEGTITTFIDSHIGTIPAAFPFICASYSAPTTDHRVFISRWGASSEPLLGQTTGVSKALLLRYLA
jgi:hypothetical protein